MFLCYDHFFRFLLELTLVILAFLHETRGKRNQDVDLDSSSFCVLFGVWNAEIKWNVCELIPFCYHFISIAVVYMCNVSICKEMFFFSLSSVSTFECSFYFYALYEFGFIFWGNNSSKIKSVLKWRYVTKGVKCS